MSLIPGILGQKTELLDGAKMDSISEYTLGNGVQSQGRTNGVTVPTGNIGEIISMTGSGLTAIINPICNVANEGTWQDVTNASASLTKGFWLFDYNILLDGSFGSDIKTVNIALRDSSNNILHWDTPAGCGSRFGWPTALPIRSFGHVGSFSLTSDTTIKISIKMGNYDVGGSGTISWRGDVSVAATHWGPVYIRFIRRA